MEKLLTAPRERQKKTMQSSTSKIKLAIQKAHRLFMLLLGSGVKKATDGELESASSVFETAAIWSGVLVVFGLFVEVRIAYLHPPYNSFLEQWGNVIADALVAVGVLFEIMFSARESACQNEQVRRSNEKLEAAYTLAVLADGRAASARSAADAAQIEVARANERAAEANERAKQIENENIKIRERVAGRRITKEQHDLLCVELSGLPATFDLQCMSEGECGLYASDILNALTAAGWAVGNKDFLLGEIWTGLIVFQSDDPAMPRLLSAFMKAKIQFLIGDFAHKKPRATIMVGAKPSAFP